eukprot:364983-Chlamydomonas_euryale.AAC.10
MTRSVGAKTAGNTMSDRRDSQTPGRYNTTGQHGQVHHLGRQGLGLSLWQLASMTKAAGPQLDVCSRATCNAWYRMTCVKTNKSLPRFGCLISPLSGI